MEKFIRFRASSSVAFALVWLICSLTPLALAAAPKLAIGSKLPVPTRIVGGVPASPKEFPYQVSLRYNGRHLCGGSIITRTHVVTAAHCIISSNPGDFSVLAGTVNIGGAGSAVGQVRAVSSLVVHPQFDPNTNLNDIAILVLSEPLTFDGSNVGGIALPDSSSARQQWGDIFVITGWGSMEEGGATTSELRKATLTLVGPAQCRAAYAPFSVGIADSMVCAEGPGRDTCQGDSGGPLALIRTGSVFGPSQSKFLIGITSFGNGCARPGYPGVYTLVESFRGFIRAYAGV